MYLEWDAAGSLASQGSKSTVAFSLRRCQLRWPEQRNKPSLRVSSCWPRASEVTELNKDKSCEEALWRTPGDTIYRWFSVPGCLSSSWAGMHVFLFFFLPWAWGMPTFCRCLFVAAMISDCSLRLTGKTRRLWSTGGSSLFSHVWKHLKC